LLFYLTVVLQLYLVELFVRIIIPTIEKITPFDPYTYVGGVDGTPSGNSMSPV